MCTADTCNILCANTDYPLDITTQTIGLFDFNFIRLKLVFESYLWDNCIKRDWNCLRKFDIAKDILKRISNDLYHFSVGHFNIRHAQLLMNSIKFNVHLISIYVDSPKCTRRLNLEGSNLYLLHCPLYVSTRQNIIIFPVSPVAEWIRHLPLDRGLLVCLGKYPAWGTYTSYLKVKQVQAG